ncbi:MAG TPA: 2Fe-2S iron-sulfur cluster-binding protein, partial [Hydrogenophaga sp.]|nr:2Fe-2S iron-sulfur cluster-binding protein [Hydrogenophaga sp.]
MNSHDLPQGMAPIAFTLNSVAVEAVPGESLLKVAQRMGVAIPHLCHQDGLRSPGNCRACVVEIEGERVLAPSCCRAPTPGMVVSTESPRAATSRKTVLELLLADAPQTETLKHDSELAHWAEVAGAQPGRFPLRTDYTVHVDSVEGLASTSAGLRQAQPERISAQPERISAQPARASSQPGYVASQTEEIPVPQERWGADTSHPAMTVNLSACIQCTRCIRAC